MVLWGTEERLCGYNSNTQECDFETYITEMVYIFIPWLVFFLVLTVIGVLAVCGCLFGGCIVCCVSQKTPCLRFKRMKQVLWGFRIAIICATLALMIIILVMIALCALVNSGFVEFSDESISFARKLSEGVRQSTHDIAALPWSNEEYGVNVDGITNDVDEIVGEFQSIVDNIDDNMYIQDIILAVIITIFGLSFFVALLGIVISFFRKKWLFFIFGVGLLLFIIIPTIFGAIANGIEAFSHDISDEYDKEKDNFGSSAFSGLIGCENGALSDALQVANDVLDQAEATFCSIYNPICNQSELASCPIACSIDDLEQIRTTTEIRDVLLCNDTNCPSVDDGGLNCNEENVTFCYSSFVPLNICHTECLSQESRNVSNELYTSIVIAEDYLLIVNNEFIPLLQCSFIIDFINITDDSIKTISIAGWFALLCLISLLLVIPILFILSFATFQLAWLFTIIEIQEET